MRNFSSVLHFYNSAILGYFMKAELHTMQSSVSGVFHFDQCFSEEPEFVQVAMVWDSVMFFKFVIIIAFVSTSSFINCSLSFYYEDKPYFIYPCISWRTFGCSQFLIIMSSVTKTFAGQWEAFLSHFVQNVPFLPTVSSKSCQFPLEQLSHIIAFFFS